MFPFTGVRPVLNRYILELRSNSHSEHTVHDYGDAIRRWQRSGLSPVDYLATVDVKPSTRNLWAVILRRYLDWCVERGYEPENPLAGIPFHQPPAPEVRPFSEAEMSALLAACRRPLERAIIVCLARLGVRASELAGVRAQDLEGDILLIRKGKGAKPRRLATTGLLEHLRVIMDAQLKYRQLYGRVRAIGKRAGIEGVHPHRFRHTWANACLEAGMSENNLRVLAGWSSFTMLKRYTAYLETQRAITAHRRFLENVATNVA
jgi:integrase